MAPVSFAELSSHNQEESSIDIRKRVASAREKQNTRFNTKTISRSNANMTKADMNHFCKLSKSSAELIEMAMNKLHLSARAYDRILKVARTIADLDQKASIERSHVAEAIQYRALDKMNQYFA